MQNVYDTRRKLPVKEKEKRERVTKVGRGGPRPRQDAGIAHPFIEDATSTVHPVHV